MEGVLSEGVLSEGVLSAHPEKHMHVVWLTDEDTNKDSIVCDTT